MSKIYDGSINDEYPINVWVNLYNKGCFSRFSRRMLIDMGGFDWFGSDRGFYNTIIKDIATKVCALAKSNKVNPDEMYVFFKQNCPCIGPLYCDFRICDIHTGDVRYCISHLKNGCYGNSFQGWEVYDFTDKTKEFNCNIVRGSWNDIKKYFNI